MTVKELIAYLKDQPSDARVYLGMFYENGDSQPAEEFELAAVMEDDEETIILLGTGKEDEE